MKSALMRRFLTFMFSFVLVLLSQGSHAELATAPLYLSIKPTPPNIMLMIDTSGSMSNTVTGDTRSRMTVAKTAAQNLVTQLTPLPGAPTTARIGITVYNSSVGGKLLQPLIPLDNSTTATSIKNKIGTLTAGGVTPLATTLSDIGYYFSTGYNFPSSTNTLTVPAQLAVSDSAVNIFKKTSDTSCITNPDPKCVTFANFTPPTASTTSTMSAGTSSCPLVTHTITPADMPPNTPPSGCGAFLPTPTGTQAGGTRTATTNADGSITYVYSTEATTPVQMVIVQPDPLVSGQPMFCMTNTTTGLPACTSETVFHIGNGLTNCGTCRSNPYPYPIPDPVTNRVREIIAISTNPNLTLNPNSSSNTTPNITTANATTALAVHSTAIITQTVTPAITGVTTAPTVGYTLSDTFLSPSGTPGTPEYYPGVCSINSDGLLTGLGNGKCRICGDLASTTKSTYAWTGGSGTAATPPSSAVCNSSSVDTQYCPGWNGGAACTKITDFYYVGDDGLTHNGSAPNTDVIGSSCTSTSSKWCLFDYGNDGACGTGQTQNRRTNCLQCSCFPSPTCTLAANNYCSNGSLGTCGASGGNCCASTTDPSACYVSECKGAYSNASGGTGCKLDSACQTATCDNLTCSNTGAFCTQDSTCYTASCRKQCSNNPNQSCTANNGCYLNTCVVYDHKCSNDYTKSCNTANDCYPNTNTCSIKFCSGHTSTSCTTIGDSGGPCGPSGYGSCVGKCSNNTNTSCTTDATCNPGVVCGTSENDRCIQNFSLDCNRNQSDVAICNPGVTCSSTKYCSNATTTSCTGDTNCNSGVSCSGYCSDAPGTSCSSNSACNTGKYCANPICKNKTTGVATTGICTVTTGDAACNFGVACNTCATVTPATCTPTTTGTSCAKSQLDIVIGDGTYAGNTSGGTNNTGGTTTTGYYCFKDDLYYTVQYNGGADPMGPYTGAQLNWYFSQTTVPNAVPAINTPFNEGSLEMPNYATPGSDCTCTCNLNTDGTSSCPSGVTPNNTPCTSYGIHCPNGICSSSACQCAQSYSDNLPIQKWCQKSFAILVSDGLPNQDRTVNMLLRNYKGDCCDSTIPGDCTGKTTCDAKNTTVQMPGTTALLNASSTNTTITPTCTGINPRVCTCAVNVTTGATNCNKIGGACNMACQNGSKANRAYETGGSDYLDDVAKALYDMDLRPDLRATATTGSDQANSKNNLVTYTIGFADPSVTGNSTTSTSVLQDAATVGGGRFFPATDAAGLTAALNAVRTNIAAQVGSSASIATNSTQVGGESMIYQAKFDSGGWFGNLSAFAINPTDGGIGNIQWDAATKIPAANVRNIFTYNGAAGTPFLTWANLTTEQKNYLQTAITGNTTNTGATLGQWRVDYIRGDKTHEVINPQRKLDDPNTESRLTSNTLIFRNRTRLNPLTKYSVTLCDIYTDQNCDTSPIDPWVLGDIVNSNPAYVGSTENYGYSGLSPEGGTYTTFVNDVKSTRRPMVYVGANDGMLHGFDAGSTAGQEIMAYLPNAVYSNLANFTDPNYSHKYFVDGSPVVNDAYFGSAWHTVLIGTTGAGGKAVFALDITDPDSFTGDNVLWEVAAPSLPDLGYTISQAAIVRTKDASNPWAALVANGYYNTNNRAVLYILNISTGAIIRAIDATPYSENGFTTNNGLSTPFPADINGDNIVDYVYAGDLRGNLWKFDLTSPTASNWRVANGGAPLYIACDADLTRSNCTQDHRQSITTRPVVGLSAETTTPQTYEVYFGTGKYFDTVDNTTAIPTQTFYGIIDRGTSTTTAIVPSSGPVRSSTLNPQVITTGGNWRTTTSNPCGTDGWYMDLDPGGERVIYSPLLRQGRIIFTTMVPTTTTNADSCSVISSGTGWLMELSATCGTVTDKPAWDTNGDNVINSSDTSYTGKKSTVGIPTTPGIIGVSNGLERKYITGSSGEIENFRESNAGNAGGSSGTGRQSWRQIR